MGRRSEGASHSIVHILRPSSEFSLFLKRGLIHALRRARRMGFVKTEFTSWIVPASRLGRCLILNRDSYLNSKPQFPYLQNKLTLPKCELGGKVGLWYTQVHAQHRMWSKRSVNTFSFSCRRHRSPSDLAIFPSNWQKCILRNTH